MPIILTSEDPCLRTASAPVLWPDPALDDEIRALHAALRRFRSEHGYGRAIAAPQIGVLKRIIALDLGAGPLTMINPDLVDASTDEFEVWDDCMSVPDRIVRVSRHRTITVRFLDERGRQHQWRNPPADLSELLQHEMDHLDGVLMLDRAVGESAVRPSADHARLVAPSRPSHRLSLDAIATAATSIDQVFVDSPQYRSDSLSSRLGCGITLKIETVNPIRSFKGRGADFFLAAEAERGAGGILVCASAGNFGQAMAYAARRHRRELVVFAADNANPLKVERMRQLGAEVRQEGSDFDAAKLHARAFCEQVGVPLIEDGREAEISEGAGSMAVEILGRGDAYDAVIVPLGNGALLNGVARWFKAASPWTETIGVSSVGADAMEKSFRAGQVVERDQVETIADGIGVRVPIPEAVADMAGIVDDVMLVEDHHIVEAMQMLHAREGLVVEPAGATGLAAIVAEPDRFRDRSVVTVVAGGNLDPAGARRYLLP